MNQRISCFICQLSFVLVLDLIGPIKEIRRPKANILRSVFWHQLRRISWRLSAIGLPLLNVLGNLLLVQFFLRQRLLPILRDYHRYFFLPGVRFLFSPPENFSLAMPRKTVYTTISIENNLSRDLCASISAFVVKGLTEGLRRFFSLLALPDILSWPHSLWKISKTEILWREMTVVQNLRQYSRENRHRCTITDYHMVRWGDRPLHQWPANTFKDYHNHMWCKPRPFWTGQFSCQDTYDRGSHQMQHLSQVRRYMEDFERLKL